jgi:hypothetical protein
VSALRAHRDHLGSPRALTEISKLLYKIGSQEGDGISQQNID